MGTYYPKKEQRETPVYKMFRQKYLGSWISANMNEQKDGMTISERREIIVKILPRIMEKILFSKENIRIRSRIPEGAKIKYIRWNDETDTFDIRAEHSSFPPTPEGGILPIYLDGIFAESDEEFRERKIKKLKE